VAVGKPVGLPLQREKGGVSALAFSPDGKMLISGGTDGTLVIWDVESRKQLGPPVPAHEDGVDALAFRHGGRALVSIGDKKLIVWDLHPENWIQTGCRTANRNLTETEWARYLPDVPYRPSCRF
jgi:WD40 repeat protein